MGKGAGQERVAAVRARLLRRGPENREHLARWLELFAGLRAPRRGVCAGHGTPLDYLEHVFFERPGDAVVWACRGGGKTQAAAAATLLDLLYKPGVQVRILAGSLEQGEKMYEYLRQMTAGHFSDQLAGTPTRRRLALRNGSGVEVLAQSDCGVRGQRVQKVRCDEVELFDANVWAAAQLVTRGRRRGGGEGPAVRGSIEAISTMHVPGGLMEELVSSAPSSGRKVFSWCVWDVVERCPAERVCGDCVLADDCQGRARSAEGFVLLEDVMAMRARVSRVVWEREMLCQRPRTQSGVFPGFSRASHVAASGWAAAEGEWVWGIDFGFRQFVCLMVQVRGRGEQRQLYVAEELVAEQRALFQNVEALRQRVSVEGGWPAPMLIYCDPAGEAHNSQTGMRDVELLRRAGWKVKYQSLPVERGLEAIEGLLRPAQGEARLHIHPRCVRLIAALERYRRDERSGEPVKDGVYDHCVDALRYAVCGAMGVGWHVEFRLY